MESKTWYKNPTKQIPKQKPSATHSYADTPNQCCFYTNDFRY